MTPQSVADILARALYGRTAPEAQEAGECIRCRGPVVLDDLDRRDFDEYRLTALCPACFSAICDSLEGIA